MESSQHTVILLAIMVTVVFILLGLIIAVLHYCRMQRAKRKQLGQRWPGLRAASTDQATSTTTLDASIANLLRQGQSLAHGSGRKEDAGECSFQLVSDGVMGSRSKSLSADCFGSGQASNKLVCWRLGLEPSLGGIQKITGSAARVGSHVLEKHGGSISSSPHQEEGWHSSLKSLEIQSDPSMPESSCVPGPSCTGINRMTGLQRKLSIFFTPSFQLQPQHPATPASCPGEMLPVSPATGLLSDLLGSEKRSLLTLSEVEQLPRSHSASESSIVPSTPGCNLQMGSSCSANVAEVWGKIGSQHSLLEWARSSTLFQRSRAWFISWTDSRPKPGNAARQGGSPDSSVDADSSVFQGKPREKRGRVLWEERAEDGVSTSEAVVKESEPGAGSGWVSDAPLQGIGTDAAESDLGGCVGRLREVAVCPQEAAIKLGGTNHRTPWQRLEERPLIAIN